MREHGVMRLLTAAAFVLFLFATLPGCKGKGPLDYWPLEPGNIWVYKIEQPARGPMPDKWTFSVLPSEEKGPTRKVIVQTRGGSFGAVTDIEMIITPEGIYETGHSVRNPNRLSSDSGGEVEIKPEGDSLPFLIKGSPRVGQSWSYSFTSHFKGPLQPRAKDAPARVAEVPGEGSGTVEAEEKVTVPAGEFKAMRIVSSTGAKSPPNAPKRERIYWFARGIGPVKMQLSTGLGPRTFDLVEARIGKVKITRKSSR